MSGSQRSRARTRAALAGFFAFGLVAAGAGTYAFGQDSAETVSTETAQEQTLRDLADQLGVRMGTAVSPHLLDEQAYYDTAAGEFNTVTHENDLKWESVQPQEGEYSFDGADSLMEFAAEHDQNVHGHTLVWHSQLPDWVENGDFTPEELTEVMRDHIDTTMGRYAGEIQSWDVVNEFIDDQGGQFRDSVFYEVLGEDFVAEALTMAHEADPSADLFINDYSIDGINEKSDAYYDVAADLVDQGVPLDGIGLQGHLIVGQVPDDLRENIERFVDLGLEVVITELDVRMDMPATEADLEQQASDYAEVFEICLDVEGCTGVSVWGVTDAHSWVPDHFEGEGAALPIGEDYERKPAYWAIHEALGGDAGPDPTDEPTEEPTDEPTEEPTDEPTEPAGDCEAEYALASEWDDGFQTEVTITAGSDLDGWTVSWAFAGDESVEQAWNASISESGGQVSATNAEHNGELAAGESTTFGFLGAGAPGSTPELTCTSS